MVNNYNPPTQNIDHQNIEHRFSQELFESFCESIGVCDVDVSQSYVYEYEEFLKFIESQWDEDMSWDNYDTVWGIFYNNKNTPEYEHITEKEGLVSMFNWRLDYPCRRSSEGQSFSPPFMMFSRGKKYEETWRLFCKLSRENRFPYL